MSLDAISANTIDLVNRLNIASVSRGNPRNEIANLPEILRSIGDSGEALAIGHVLDFALDEDPHVSAAAWEAVHRLFSSVDIGDLTDFEQRMRGHYKYSTPRSSWYRMVPADLFNTDHRDDLIALGLATFHPNGYIRQAATVCLGNLRDARVLPFLLIRLNDWVSEVRESAFAAAESWVDPGCASAWVPCLPLAVRFAESRRSNRDDFLRRVLALLQTPPARSALRDAANSDDKVVRRTCYPLLFDSPGENQPAILTEMVFDHDPILRKWALHRLETVLDPERLHQLLPRMERDRWTPIRHTALTIHAKLWPAESEPVLRRALLDSSPAIRQTARQSLAHLGNDDFRSIYFQALTSPIPNLSAVAISAIGEVGSKDDTRIVAPFLGHAVPKVRRAAVGALSRLDSGSFTDSFLTCLGDESISVSRAAFNVLRPNAVRLSTSRVWQVFAQTTHLHGRLYALALMGHLGRWRGIPMIVRATSDHDAAISKQAVLGVAGWLGSFIRGYSRPSLGELQDLETALAEAGSSLDAQSARELDAIVTRWRSSLNRPPADT